MKPNDAGEDMWLWAETANENLKEEAQTQDADGMQDLSVLHMTQVEVISQHHYVLWMGVRGR